MSIKLIGVHIMHEARINALVLWVKKIKKESCANHIFSLSTELVER